MWKRRIKVNKYANILHNYSLFCIFGENRLKVKILWITTRC
nr:MAG TPA: hypothetical protein [Caudoviricetes sp.]